MGTKEYEVGNLKVCSNIRDAILEYVDHGLLADNYRCVVMISCIYW